MEITQTCVPGLWIGHLFCTYFVEAIDIVRKFTPVFKSGALLSAPADEYPDIPLIVYHQGRIIMWIVHSFLVIYHSGLRYHAGFMVKISDHA